MDDVVVVGAGPVGLTAALAVRATGRPVTVIETGAADRVRPGSRAIFLHRVTLDVLDRIRPGLGLELSRQGLGWQTKRTLYRGREVYRRTYPPPRADALPAATSLPQVVTERILLDACIKAGVTFTWNTAVTGASAGASGVRLDTADGRAVTAGYVIAADGSRSVVRESLGLRLEGPRTSNAYVIVDIAEDPAAALPLERVFHYEHPAVGHRNVLLVPFAGHWRVDLQCHPGDNPDDFGSEAGVRDWLVKVLPAKYADRVTWVSTYVFRQAIATAFTDADRRVLLAGEAGHVFAPFGARGLNSGVADARVAARAINSALRCGTEAERRAVLDDAAAARLEAAARNRAASSTALRHLQAGSRGGKLIRRTAAVLAPVVPAFGTWLDKAPFGPTLGAPDRFGMHY